MAGTAIGVRDAAFAKPCVSDLRAGFLAHRLALVVRLLPRHEPARSPRQPSIALAEGVEIRERNITATKLGDEICMGIPALAGGIGLNPFQLLRAVGDA